MLRDSGMEESRHPKIAELRKFMLNRPSKAVLAPVAEGFGALAAALSKPFVPREGGYVQVDSGQKSRKVRNHMLRSPFKSVIARTAIFALVLSIGIAFVSAGMDPYASAQQTTTDPCTQDATTKVVTCNYDENDTVAVANFSAMDPEGETIAWSLSSTVSNTDDANYFDITGGVLSFKSSPNYEDPKGAPDTGNALDNTYKITVTATEVRAPGSLVVAQSTDIKVVVDVKDVEEDPTLTLNRLQVRAGSTEDTGRITAELKDPDGVEGNVNYTWFVPKVSRPVLDNDDHWVAATGTPVNNGDTHVGAIYPPQAADDGKYLRVVATYSDGTGSDDKAYARSAYPVAAVRSANNRPTFPAGTPNSFTVSEHVAVGTVIGTVRGGDTDSADILSHILTPAQDNGGPNGSNRNEDKFTIDIATGQIKVASKLNYEGAPDATASDRTGDGKKDYTFTVTVYDPTGQFPEENSTRGISGTGALTVYVGVTDQNDAPGKPTVGVVGTHTVDGFPNNDNRTYVKTVNDVTVPSYEVPENHAVKDVAASDGPPPITAEWAIVIATFTVSDSPATDPDGSTTPGNVTDGDPASSLKLTTGGPDGGLFNLTNNTGFGGNASATRYDLVFKKSPNFESPADADGNNKYHVTIVTTDNEGASSELPLVITVTNEDEKGAVKLSTTQPAIGQPITATLTDPDMKVSEVKWQWGRSETGSGYIPIQGATSATYTPVATVEDDPVTTANEGVDGDEGMYLEVTVTYVDNASEDEDDPSTTEVDERTRELKEESDNAVRVAPNVNQAPSFATGIARTVPEDAGDDGKVGGPVTAVDPDAGDALTYRISGGADMGSFNMSSAGQITVKKGSTLDYEGSQTTFTVEVTATDPFGLTASTTVTITVTDVNEKPKVTAPGAPCTGTTTVSCDYDENGTVAVGTFSAEDPEGETIAWSLSGDDAEDFDITGGVLSFKSSPDYETPKGTPDTGDNADNTYEITVTATEVRAPGSLDIAQSTSITVVVTVEDVEEDPTLTLNRLQVRAGSTEETGRITAELKDPDGVEGNVNYTWFVPKVSRPVLDNDDHWIAATGTPVNNGSTHVGAIYPPQAADDGKYLRVVATYSDGTGSDDKAYARSAYPVAAVRSANNRPTFPAGTPNSFTVSEHVAVGTVIGTVRGGDTDSADILSHVLTATGAPNVDKFAIDIATGQIKVASKLNYEEDEFSGDTRQYTFTVTVYDPTGQYPEANTARGISNAGALTVNVKVTDQNDAPTTPTVGVVGAISSTQDPNDGNRTYVDATDANKPSYVVPENHAVKDVAASDGPPPITAEWAIVIATFTVSDSPATDPDGGTSTSEGDPASTLKLTTGGPDGGLFNLTNNTGFGDNASATRYDLVFKKSPNYESPADADGNNKYHVTIVTTDNEGASSQLPLVITVTNVDEEGAVKLSTTQPAIGQPITATLTDPDMKVSEVKWQWGRSETGSGYIPIQGATSATYTPVATVEDDPVTTANEGVDGDEGMYLEVTVTYVDNASEDEDDPSTTEVDERTRELKEESDNAVRVAPNVNQAPSFATGIARTVPEDAGDNGKVGGPVTATDPDGDALTYRISGGADMDAFAIGSTTGQITVKKGSTLDYEGSQTTFTVEVTATDPFGMSASTTVTITVTDVNEAPVLVLQPGGTTPPGQGVVGGRASVNVVEGTTAIGTYTTQIASPTWSLSGADAGDFSITSGGVLSFRTAPDYESPADANRDNSYTVTVVASNGGGTSATLVVTVTVTNDPSDDGSTFDPLTYDTDNSGSIERSEVIQAIRDYFADTISQADVRAVIRSYFSS